MKQIGRVVCLGDSITWGFPFGPQYSWVHMLAQATGLEFINRGINGNTTGDMLDRFDRDVLKSRPDMVIISGGINDILYQESYDRITWNLRTMAEKAMASGIPVVLGMPTAVDSPYLEKLLKKLRQWYIDYSRDWELPLINFYQAFFNPDGALRHELLLADGAHPSEAGYREMFGQIDLNIFCDLRNTQDAPGT